MTVIRTATMNITGAPLEGENPLPFFRDRKQDIDIGYVEPFPEEKKDKFGEQVGFRLLPYRFQDRFSRKRAKLQFKQILMENEHLKATFLPELGGRLSSLIDKATGRELLSRNPVFQPGNLAIRKAWFSGGIEWNIGQVGHAFHTCSSVFAATVHGEDGTQFLRLYEFERCKRLFWQIDFYLPEDSRVLYAYTRVVNPNREDTPMYWWTNIAVPETPEVRVFASAEEIIYIDPGAMAGEKKVYGYSKMPELPLQPGEDFSYPSAFPYSNEYFFQCPPGKNHWEAAAYKNGEVFFEVSTERLRYRKMFCWGNHPGGKRWQEFLAVPGEAYLEIQAGLAPTQHHGLDMPAGAVWDWTQAFGGASVEPEYAHDGDWQKAKDYIGKEIKRKLPEAELYQREKMFRDNAGREPGELLHTGSGWGALEVRRMAAREMERPPEGLVFPEATLGEEQYPWLNLLEEGYLGEKEPGQLPGAWMVQKEWKLLLDSSLKEENNRSWYALLHAGVMEFEAGREELAIGLWEESIKKCESPWSYRNLAVAEKIKGRWDKALEYMDRAMELPGASGELSLAVEYLELLRDMGRYQEVWRAYRELPEGLQGNERLRLVAGTAAIELGEYAFVESLFHHEFAGIKEGEVILTDLWFRYKAIKLAEEKGTEADEDLLRYVRENYEPPRDIDFRMVNK